MGAIMFAVFLAASLLSGRAVAEATTPDKQPDFWLMFMSTFMPVIPIVIILFLLLYTKKGQTILAASLLVSLGWLKTDSEKPKK